MSNHLTRYYDELDRLTLPLASDSCEFDAATSAFGASFIGAVANRIDPDDFEKALQLASAMTVESIEQRARMRAEREAGRA